MPGFIDWVIKERGRVVDLIPLTGAIDWFRLRVESVCKYWKSEPIVNIGNDIICKFCKLV